MVHMKRAPKGTLYRTAVVPVRLEGRNRRKAFDLTHRAGLLYTALARHCTDVYRNTGRSPIQKEAMAWAAATLEPEILRMHAHSKQGVFDRLADNTATALTNIASGEVPGARLPHRAKKYMPVTFTRNFGWQATSNGRLALSLGRSDGRIFLPVPNVTDPRTGQQVPPESWGEIELCWNRDQRRWLLHIAYRTRLDLPELDPNQIVAIDEGIINPMTLAVETSEAFEVVVINGRAARAARHRRNKATSAIASAKARCTKGSRRWRKLDRAEKKARATSEKALRNIDHQVTRKAANFAVEHRAGTVVAGDVRGIEQHTRQVARKRTGRHQRRRLSQWSRGRQERYLTEKTGVQITHIPEDYSSKTCPGCNRRNRPTGRNYQCRNCGFTCHRDAVGALNILMRARYGTYQPIDPTTPIRVTYLRATPLPRTARSTATMQATTPNGVVQESEAPYPIQAAA